MADEPKVLGRLFRLIIRLCWWISSITAWLAWLLGAMGFLLGGAAFLFQGRYFSQGNLHVHPTLIIALGFVCVVGFIEAHTRMLQVEMGRPNLLDRWLGRGISDVRFTETGDDYFDGKGLTHDR